MVLEALVNLTELSMFTMGIPFFHATNDGGSDNGPVPQLAAHDVPSMGLERRRGEHGPDLIESERPDDRLKLVREITGHLVQRHDVLGEYEDHEQSDDEAAAAARPHPLRAIRQEPCREIAEDSAPVPGHQAVDAVAQRPQRRPVE